MRRLSLLLLAALLAACATSPAAPTPAAPTSAPAATTPAGPPPTIRAVTADQATLGRYERIELTADLTAAYENPFDSQEVALSATFRAPSGKAWQVPGFWDGRDAWKVRFTPGEVGRWSYSVAIRDRNGTAESPQASFEVGASERHGWLQVANWHDPKLSSRYLIYHDGAPFYGVGHCEAFTLGDARTDASGDLKQLVRMRESGENLVVWWPHSTFTFFSSSYKTYDRVDMALIDSYLESADRLGMSVVYTIWDHNLLRGPEHPWRNGRWEQNGFRYLNRDAAAFFSDPTSWRWQENLYRYIIARWGYSPSLIWMTVSELDGTSAGGQMDAWHAKVNDYFVRNDPYRHPTTASLSGDKLWSAGFAVADIPQVHLYNEQKDALRMGDSVAEWTARMWKEQARPNVVGEFGTTLRAIDLPLLHNSIWGALMSGAAITPLRWSDRGNWGRTSDAAMAQLGHLGHFVADLPLAQYAWEPAQIEVAGEGMVARGLAAEGYAIVWVQDRHSAHVEPGVRITVAGLQDGSYTVRPYDTWGGAELPALQGSASGGDLTIELPAFEKDIALKLVRE